MKFATLASRCSAIVCATGIIDYTFKLAKKPQWLDVLTIVANQKNILKKADLIQPEYLLVEWNQTTPPALTAIKVYYPQGVVEHIAIWLIEYFKTLHSVEWQRDENGATWRLPLPFMRELLPNSEIKIECDAAVNKLQLVNRCTYVCGEERGALFGSFRHTQYQTQTMRVMGNMLKQPLGFQLVTNEMIICCPHRDHIVDLQILFNGKQHLHYNELLLSLYAKKVGANYLRIFYNHRDGDDWGSCINHSRTDDPTLLITWRDGLHLDATVEVAVKGLNVSCVGGERGQLICTTFPIDNLGDIRSPWSCNYSMHREGGTCVEGYWWEGSWQNTKLPIPLPAAKPVAPRYIGWLREIWQCAMQNRNGFDESSGNVYKRLIVGSQGYLGSSNCRICNCINGSYDIYLCNKQGVKFKISQGFIHYLERHNIHVSPELATFLDESCGGTSE